MSIANSINSDRRDYSFSESQGGFSRFTPLESPSIYAGAGEGGNRKHQLLIEGGVKLLAFLTGFTPASPPP
jgi:hypothetical protein